MVSSSKILKRISFALATSSKLELTLNNKDQIEAINKLELNGNTSVYFHFKGNNKKLSFKLKKNRKVDRNSLNFLKKEGIITQIS